MTAAETWPAEGAARRPRMTSAERRTDLLVAARRVFATYGFAGARTRDIAAEAGINEALVYRHFRSKLELFEAAVVEPLQEAMAELNDMADPSARQYDETGEVTFGLFRDHVRSLLVSMDEVGPLLGVMLFGDATTAPGYYHEHLAPYFAKNTEFLLAGLHAWPHRDFDAPVAVQSVFATVWFRSTVARLSGTPLDYDAEAETIADLMTRGYLPRP